MATTVQDEALDKALLLLGEHFDHVTIICDAPDVEYPNEDGPSLFIRKKGASWEAVGLMETYKAYLMRQFLDNTFKIEGE